MPKRSANDYVSDDGFVQDDSASPPPQTKRAKTNRDSTSSSNAKGAAGAISSTAQKDDNGDDFWELTVGGSRRVVVNEFKGKMMVSIREYYEANGKRLPGKKGISLSVASFSALIDALPEIEAALGRKGETIPRPMYVSGVAAGSAANKTTEEAVTIKDERQNFEATSDEDEG